MADEKEQTVVIATRVTLRVADAAYKYAREQHTTVADILRDSLPKATNPDPANESGPVNSGIQKDKTGP